MQAARRRWWVGISAVLGVLLVETFRHNVLDRHFVPITSGAISDAILVLGAASFTHVVLSWIDRANEQTLLQQRKLNAIFDYSSDAVVLTDSHARILRANPATERLTGRSESELIGTHLFDSLCRATDGGVMPAAKCPVMEVVRTNQAIPYRETMVQAGNGRLLPVTTSFSPVPDEAGSTVQVAVVLRDLSEKRALEAEVARLLAETEHRRRQAEALYEIGRSLASLRAVPWDPEAALTRTREILGADVAVLAVPDPQGPEILLPSSSGSRDPHRLAALRLRRGEDVPGRVISSGRALKSAQFPHDLTDSPTAYPLMVAEGLQSCQAAPVLIRNEVSGAILVGYRQPHVFGENEEQFLASVTSELGIALENARLYRQVEEIATLEERDRLAREMHDGLAQALAALHWRLEALALAARSGVATDLARDLEGLKAACSEAYGDVRRAILNLRQRLPAGTDLAGYLAEYLHQFARDHRLQVSLSQPETGLPPLPPVSEAELIRILPEVLHNAAKHAQARSIQVSLQTVDREMVVTVQDDGVGFDPAALRAPGHYGLAIMHERAERAGGHLTVQSAPGSGTSVRIVLPLAEPEWKPAHERGEPLGAHSHPAGG